MQCVNWKKLLILNLIATSSLGVASCDPKAPKVERPNLYTTNHETQVIGRKIGKDKYDIISCAEPRFNEFLCINKDEYVKKEKELIDAAQQCKEWK